MKQKLRFDFVILKGCVVRFSSCLYKFSVLTVTFLVLFISSASAQMVQQWEVLATTEGSTEQRFSDSALDSDGNVYMLGSQDSPSVERTMTLMKYDTNGNKLWHKKLENFEFSHSEFPTTLKVGKDGDVYVLAVFSRTTGGQGILFYKVSPEGSTQWIRPYGYQSGSIDRAYDFELSSNDDLYVAGFHSSTQGHDMFALKFDKAGNMLWEKRLDNMKGHSTYGPTLALDPAGDPYIAVRGRIFSQDNEPNPLLIKLDRTSGQVLFTKKYTEAGIAGNDIDPRRIHINPDGTVYMVSQRGGMAVIVSKSKAAGDLIWARSEDAGNVWDMAVDAEENLIFSTWSSGTQLTKYSKEGEKVWAKQYQQGSGRAVAVDAEGNIAVTGGIFSMEAMRNTMVLTKYDKHGETLFEKLFESAEPLYSEGYNVHFDRQNNLYLSGAGRAEGKGVVIAMKYGAATNACDTPVAVKLVLPPGGQQVGKAVSTTAMLEAEKLPANVVAQWVWGDGATSAAYHTPGANQVTGQHTYTSTGVYLPQLKFTDACLESTGPENMQPLAIYDPNAGFVTGGGWFTPSGIPEQVKVQFDFNIRYKEQGKENLQLTGATSFKLSNALRFESTNYDWLVVQEDKAVWQGSGQINGRGNFGFTISVVDAGEGKQQEGDMLRLRIWDKHEGNKLYYDSHAADNFAYFLSDQGPAIGGGNIVIHRKGNLYAENKDGVDAQELVAGELTAYPNPFAGTSTLRFELKEQSNYTVALYDMKGVLVQELRPGSAQANEVVEVQVDASALPKGMYLARLVTDHETRSVKLVVQK
ncbi:T9SS type A sorting domain-containing protein [Pontibacter sp. BT731]|uniref:T9SS type A sorting domain-containing protein n=1 Tax=Pontibacter coccineus TaxID=3063328 RepID=UPI0026E2261B|nr:T9SS type A sorting domain-containing protein [Pontibacter sp. BT731]